MRAYAWSLEHPFAAVTNEKGEYESRGCRQASRFDRRLARGSQVLNGGAEGEVLDVKSWRHRELQGHEVGPVAWWQVCILRSTGEPGAFAPGFCLRNPGANAPAGLRSGMLLVKTCRHGRSRRAEKEVPVDPANARPQADYALRLADRKALATSSAVANNCSATAVSLSFSPLCCSLTWPLVRLICCRAGGCSCHSFSSSCC